MSWRLARSLEVLRGQIDEQWPNRSRASDGTIGDAAHQAQASDHNPNSAGVVCALDITNNPDYFNAHVLADKLLANRHPDLKYLISNRRIAGAWSNWAWENYGGGDPHIQHIHISVGVGDDGQSRQPYDDLNKWAVEGNNMPTLVDANILEDLSVGLLGRTSVGDKNLQNLIGVDVATALRTFIHYPEHQALIDRASVKPSDAQNKLDQIKKIVS